MTFCNVTLQSSLGTFLMEDNEKDKMNIFNVARVKKVELHDLSPSTKVGDDNGKF